MKSLIMKGNSPKARQGMITKRFEFYCPYCEKLFVKTVRQKTECSDFPKVSNKCPYCKGEGIRKKVEQIPFRYERGWQK